MSFILYQFTFYVNTLFENLSISYKYSEKSRSCFCSLNGQNLRTIILKFLNCYRFDICAYTYIEQRIIKQTHTLLAVRVCIFNYHIFLFCQMFYAISNILFAFSYVIFATSSTGICFTSAIFFAIHIRLLESFLVPLIGAGAR